MNETGITVTEACRNHVMSDEDFAKTCNTDGSLKNQSTTTFTLKDDPAKSITVNNAVLYAAGIGLILVIACLIILLIRRRSKKER